MERIDFRNRSLLLPKTLVKTLSKLAIIAVVYVLMMPIVRQSNSNAIGDCTGGESYHQAARSPFAAYSIAQQILLATEVLNQSDIVYVVAPGEEKARAIARETVVVDLAAPKIGISVGLATINWL